MFFLTLAHLWNYFGIFLFFGANKRIKNNSINVGFHFVLGFLGFFLKCTLKRKQGM